MQPPRRAPEVIIEELSPSESEDEFSSPLAGDEPGQNSPFQPREDREPGSSPASEPEFVDAVASHAPDADAAGASGQAEDGEQGEAAEPRPLTDAEQAALEAAERSKVEGNTLYGTGQYQEALDAYRAALEAAPAAAAAQRAVFHANAAAAALKLELWGDAAREASACLAAEPPAGLRAKALTRRGLAYERLDDLERAFTDYEKLVELDPGNAAARGAIQRLRPAVEERREKMKEEMLGKLKELGNTVLGKFGLSLDNFKAVQDPQTGSYSINFSQ